MRVALIGLGNMGSGMARNLLKAPLGAQVADTPAQAAGVEVIITMRCGRPSAGRNHIRVGQSPELAASGHAAAEDAAVPMPMASLVHDHFLAARAQGLADADWAAIARVSYRNAGL